MGYFLSMSINSTFSLEQRTTISPINGFKNNEIAKAQPKPILRLRPKQPMPYANATTTQMRDIIPICP